jgi:hypothetical protein
MNLKDIKWSQVLDGLTTVATVFNPHVGAGLKVASEVVEKITDNDDVLENNVIGLTRSAEIIEDTLNNLTLSDTEKNQRLTLVAQNLRDLSEFDRKHNLIMR